MVVTVYKHDTKTGKKVVWGFAPPLGGETRRTAGSAVPVADSEPFGQEPYAPDRKGRAKARPGFLDG